MTTSHLLASNVDVLIRDHKKTVWTPEGPEIHDRPPLLEQLHDAVFGGMEKTGGGSSLGRAPISEAALDLYTLINEQIAESWHAVTGRVPSPLATPGMLVAEWSRTVQEDAVVVVTRPEQHERPDERYGHVTVVIRVREEHTPATLTSQWVGQIEDFFNPERTAGIAAPCIQCGRRKVPRVKDGEVVESDALVFRRDRTTGRTLDARCLACATVWPPSQFEFLAKAIGIDLGIEPAEEKPRPAPMTQLSEECAEGRHGECRSVWCRSEWHLHSAPPELAAPPAIRRLTGTSSGMVEPSGHLEPLRAICPDCWTEPSVTGACMCTT